MIKKTLKSLVLIVVLLLFSGITHTQESINTIGGDATGSGGKVAYSIGQVVYTTNSSTTGSVAQGVQHAYIIISVGINETTLDISLTLFPNPTKDVLSLQISNYKNEKLVYQLYDLLGKVINTGQIISQQTQINMSSLPVATYFIHIVAQENQTYKSYKIIKTN